MASKNKKQSNQPRIENRKARHDYHIFETLECGIKLVGTEVKAVRQGKVSLAEGYVRAIEDPPSLVLHSIHIAEYPPAGPKQHVPTRTRTLLAHRREIKKLAIATHAKGITLVPLKMYFLNGRAKLLINVLRGRNILLKLQSLNYAGHVFWIARRLFHPARCLFECIEVKIDYCNYSTSQSNSKDSNYYPHNK